MQLNTKANHRDLLFELIRTNFKLRYNNSILGLIWVLMKPFLNFLMLFVVFTAFRNDGVDPNYGANLLLGIIIYTLINEGVIFGMHALTDLAGVILKVDFPRQVAVTSSVFMAVTNFTINMVIVIVITIFTGNFPTIPGLIYFVAIVSLIAFGLYGISLFSSILLVKVRDLDHIMELVMQLVFWGSGIFYSIDDIGGTFGKFLQLNPVAILIDAARKAFIYGEIVHLKQFGIIAVAAVIVYFLGIMYFKKHIRRIAEDF